ncbi:hypothetical protein [Marinomonas atlantica]|uniref:hypothetical protein n=1 Tax=Marinomonas atlantica TaxID=1806668 RepID=UPI00082C0991|nr:hypothetical protein [Marinomonas atlantica]
MVIPKELTAGLSVSFVLSLQDFPASQCVATLHLRNQNGAIDITSSAVDDDYLFSVAPSVTTEWAAGEYTAVLRVNKDDDVHQPWHGFIAINPDVAALAVLDDRSNNERMLEAVQATLERRASSDQLKLAFNGRSLEKTPLSELMQLEQMYQRRVMIERRKKAKQSLFKVSKVRMR